MSKASELMDQIVAGTSSQPPCIKTLRIPKATGWEPGHVWADWQVDPDMFHDFGAVFGGYLAAIADSFTSLAMLSTLADDEQFTTSDLRYSFFRPVSGKTLHIDARVLHRGRRMAHVEAVFTDDDGKVAGKATATEVIMPVQKE